MMCGLFTHDRKPIAVPRRPFHRLEGDRFRAAFNNLPPGFNAAWVGWIGVFVFDDDERPHSFRPVYYPSYTLKEGETINIDLKITID